MRLFPSLLFATTATTLFLTATPARAQGLESCGNIHVSAQAECTVIPPEANCSGMCSGSVQAACSAEYYADCSGGCTATLPQCELDCQAGCEGRCSADPGSFNCQADCQGQCEGNCSAYASGSEARASCEATCSGECSAQCSGTPPEVDCSGQCQASCKGGCNGEARIDCQVTCQSDFQGSCDAEMQGKCEAQCDVEEGAMFCDGQYVDAGNNLEECIAALEAIFQFDIEFHASGSCEGNTCQGEAGFSCAVDPEPKDGALWAGLMVLGLGFVRRRRAC